MTHAAALTIKGVALAHSITTARGTWKRRRGVLLRLTDDEGRVGLGEATPLPGYSPDDADASARAITSLAPRLSHGTLEIPADFDAALAGLPCARFALETALADLEAQRRGTSVAAVLAGGPALQDAPCSGLVDLGATVYSRAARRTPTLLASFAGHESAAVRQHLAEANINAPAGSFYAIEASRRIGLGDDGALRIGVAPYTDDEDVDRLLAALATL